MRSNECGLWIKSTLTTDGNYSSINYIGYAIILILTSSLNLYAVNKITKKLTEAINDGKKVIFSKTFLI